VVEGSRYGTFETLHTFTPGGGWVGTATDQPPSRMATAHGSWAKNEDGRYELTIKEYVFDDSGSFARRVTLHHVISLHEGDDRWTARGTVQVCDLDGAPLRPVVYTTINATRLAVEPFPERA